MKRLYEPKHRRSFASIPERQVPVLVHGDLRDLRFHPRSSNISKTCARAAALAAPNSSTGRVPVSSSTNRTRSIFRSIVRLMSLQETPDDPTAVAALETAARFLPRDGKASGGSRLSRRLLSLCRHRLLHGAALRRPHGAPMTAATPKLPALARQGHGEAGGAPGGLGDRPPISSRKAVPARLSCPARGAFQECKMKHATPECLDGLEPLLEEIRRHTTLKERARGVFYLRSRAMLHFHEESGGHLRRSASRGRLAPFPGQLQDRTKELLRQLSLCLCGEVRP